MYCAFVVPASRWFTSPADTHASPAADGMEREHPESNRNKHRRHKARQTGQWMGGEEGEEGGRIGRIGGREGGDVEWKRRWAIRQFCKFRKRIILDLMLLRDTV